jgi:hypothetical protein
MPTNRVVALLTPLAAALAGWFSTWVATHFPGVTIPESQLQAVFIAGALFALAPAAQWLHGWQKWETQKAETETAVQVATLGAAAAAPTVEVSVEQEDGFEDGDDFESLASPDDFEEFEDFEDFDDFDEELLVDEEPAPLGA